MPKRQNTLNTVEILAKKLKKLEKEVKNSRRRGRRRIRVLSTSSVSSRSSRSASPSTSHTVTASRSASRTVTASRTSMTSRDPPPAPETFQNRDATELAATQATPLDVDEAEAPLLVLPASPELPTPHDASSSANVVLQPVTDQVNDNLDPDILDILGIDPTSVQKYGADINKELATRLVHLATSGLDKEKRKELIDKYLVPANCAQVAAPRLNPEIKAAVADTVVKRDKAIETRQTEIAAAISCLGQTISLQLADKNKDHELLKQLMDTARILCDIQYNESVSRRNFTLYSLKKEMKEQLTNTKVDTFLFGENLPETIKTAKAVTKSVSDLKVEPSKTSRPSTSAQSSKNLNWKTGFGNRRPAPGPQRRPPPAAAASHPAPAPKPASSSRAYPQRHRQTRRR